MSSTMPKFVEPAVATTAKTLSPCSSRAARTASPRRVPSSPTGTPTTSTSITRAAEAIDECASMLQTTRQRSGRDRPAASSRSRAASRAATRAERLPSVPPWTNTPPAPAGNPNSAASQRSTSFSACTAPAPSSHDPPYRALAETTRSKAAAAFVGALGMNDRYRGSSVVMQAGARTCWKMPRAFAAPMPCSSIVRPARRVSSAGGSGLSRGVSSDSSRACE